MHGIAASQVRTQRAYKKKIEKHVVFMQPSESSSKSRIPQSGKMSTKSSSNVLLSPLEKKSPQVVRKNSSPRSGLRPADILIPMADADFLNQNPRLKRYSWHPSKTPSPTVEIPSISINEVSDEESTDWPNVHSTVRSSSVVELASEEDIKVSQSKRTSDAGSQNLNSLTPASNAVRRHASLAVDNPTRQVRQNILKRGSLAMDQIKRIQLDDVYAVYKQLGSGRFGYIKLAEHKQYKKNIAIKFFPRPQIKQNDFVREYNYSFFLSPHPNIIDTYDGMYQTNDDSAFFFVQEFSPHASLREAIESSPGGIGETATRLILCKVLSAIEFMHNENLVHRNLKAENILLFDKEFTKVKITDFGLTRKVDTTIKYIEYSTPYHPPELCETIKNEAITIRCSIDVWSLGIIIYYCLKGKFPWQKASIMIKSYWEWEQYLKRKIPALPKRWDPFTDKSFKIFKKSLNPRPKDRWTVKDLRKNMEKATLLKNQKQENEEHDYYPEEPIIEEHLANEPRSSKKRSIIHQWISNTLNTMAEISEQVVSARND
ncbi:hypothetical protein FO519_000923 [Halicephalobus sp. NKZ332]|nr:hypothetical protein FO519_000923 [Halicephalobus sp. NKZ332]